MEPFPISCVTRDDDGWTVEVGVPATYPAFRGHFPGQPVLPAIAQFQLLEEVIGRCLGSTVALSGIGSIRMRRRIRPDDTVVVRLDENPNPSLSFRFSLEVDSVRATSGTVEVRSR